MPGSPTLPATKPRTAERNIDNVILGTIQFRAWYPSPYPKEITGTEVIDEIKRAGISSRSGGGGAGGGTDLMLDNLYVCRWCFGYARDGREYLGHGKFCGLRGRVPGVRIYTHPLGKIEKGMGGRGDGVWSVWEVDGEVDSLFCQNLSLFAKLFLDNKSVFFDVQNFNYYLLVHGPTSQIIGFFSKEKMSWDNNNLACILIFPPWQRKSLGHLLIAISYEISRRQRILGGPEKPISDLGRKGYIRFWGREIARWLLELKDRPKARWVSIEDISKGTWIAVEDVLYTLIEMNVGVQEGERVRVDKEALRQWARDMRIGLEPVIYPEGFLEGYGYREESDEEPESDS